MWVTSKLYVKFTRSDLSKSSELSTICAHPLVPGVEDEDYPRPKAGIALTIRTTTISMFLDYVLLLRHEKVVSKFQSARSWAVECPQTMRYRLNMIKEHPEKKGHPRRITFWGDRVPARSLFGIIDWMWLHLRNPILDLISTSYRCFTIPRTLFGRAPSHGRNLVLEWPCAAGARSLAVIRFSSINQWLSIYVDPRILFWSLNLRSFEQQLQSNRKTQFKQVFLRIISRSWNIFARHVASRIL